VKKVIDAHCLLLLVVVFWLKIDILHGLDIRDGIDLGLSRSQFSLVQPTFECLCSQHPTILQLDIDKHVILLGYVELMCVLLATNTQGSLPLFNDAGDNVI
jgi:hypothetical protein